MKSPYNSHPSHSGQQGQDTEPHFSCVVLTVIWASHSYLWCDVVWGATEGASGHAFIHVLLTHTKVSNLDVALRV